MYVCARSRFSLFFFFNDTATTEIYTLSLHDAFRSLQGHRLLKNRSLWRNFGTLRNERWHHEKVVLLGDAAQDRKSTRLNSSHSQISYAVFCLKKKKPTHLSYTPIHITETCLATPDL